MSQVGKGRYTWLRPREYNVAFNVANEKQWRLARSNVIGHFESNAFGEGSEKLRAGRWN